MLDESIVPRVILTTLLTVMLSGSPSARAQDEPLERAPKLDEAYWKRLRDPDRRIFNLPPVANPQSIPRLPKHHPELEALRAQAARLFPLRVAISAAVGGLLLYAVDSRLAEGPFRGSVAFTFGLALPFVPLGMLFAGSLLGGRGALLAPVLGAAVASVLALALGTFTGLMGGAPQGAFLLPFPIAGALIAYEVSSAQRLGTHQGPHHPVLPLKPTLVSVPPLSVAF